MPTRRLIAALFVTGMLVAGCGSGGSDGSGGAPSPSAPISMDIIGPSSSPVRPATSSTPPPQSLVPATARRSADRRIRRATAYLGAGGVSVEALRPGTGAVFRYGASGGMYTGSIAKLYILETLLLQHQDADTALGDEQRDLATRMIENSDNDAANDLYEDVGEARGLRAAGARLGVHNTQPGSGIYWGFTRTNARDYVALLRDLLTRTPLTAASRRFALGLTGNIESDQRWGVSAAADPGTTFHLKNGWLPSDLDQGRWLVNSVGIVTVHGHRVLLAVMTQHGSSFDGGIDLVQHLARISAAVVAG